MEREGKAYTRESKEMKLSSALRKGTGEGRRSNRNKKVEKENYQRRRRRARSRARKSRGWMCNEEGKGK